MGTAVTEAIGVPNEARPPLPIYPRLDASKDIGVVRIAGAGIGNCLYAYFHAYVFAQQTGAPLIHPAWTTLKIGPLLRRERSKRFNIGLFRAPPGEITRLRKLLLLMRGAISHQRPVAGCAECEVTANSYFMTFACRNFSFAKLHPWRSRIRERFLAMVRNPIGHPVRWGRQDYIAVHVRLGDFPVADQDELENGYEVRRIPLSWYEAVIRRLRETFPDLPVHIFSDGHDEELADLLQVDGVNLRREPNDLADLVALAEARILVGSHSTFSRWAAFLGDMPTIWFRRNVEPERPTSADVPILYVGEGAGAISVEALQKQ